MIACHEKTDEVALRLVEIEEYSDELFEHRAASLPRNFTSWLSEARQLRELREQELQDEAWRRAHVQDLGCSFEIRC